MIKIKWLLPAFASLSLLCAPVVQATLIRVSDGVTVNDLALETSTVWNIDDTGQLLGAFNADVNGILWDVVFINDSFTSHFVDAGGLDATSESDADAFSQALLDHVFQDTSPYLFDTNPGKMLGCEDGRGRCFINTPYEVSASGVVKVHTLVNGDNFDLFDSGTFQAGDDLGATFALSVYADWQLSSVRVPEPSATLLMLLGILGLAINRRKALHS